MEGLVEVSPYVEVKELIQTVKQAKINIETTDLDLFEAKDMVALANYCKELSEAAYKIASEIYDSEMD